MSAKEIIKYILVLGVFLSVATILLFSFPEDPSTSKEMGGDQVLNDTLEKEQKDGYSDGLGGDGSSPIPSDARTLDEPFFRDVTNETNLVYKNDLDENVLLGEEVAGVYVSEPTDGLYSDVLVVGEEGAVFFENDNGSFSRSSLEIETKAKSALFFDYDNDGRDELYLLSNNGSVFLERREGSFETRKVGLGIEYASVQGASAADYTGNGCIDVFVIQAGNWDEERPAGYNDRNVTIEEDTGEKNRLFRGDCSNFKEVTEKAGIEGTAWSLATSFVDFTNDGYPDIHVANDFNNDVLYINNRNGTFERRVMPSFTNRNGMSSEVADVNNDGFLDIFVSNIWRPNSSNYYRYGGRVEGNNLLINQGNGTFEDVAEEYGVRRGGWGWAAVLEDFNNDGRLDLYQASTLSGGDSVFWVSDDRYHIVEPESAGLKSSRSFGVVAFDYNIDGRMDMLESDLGDRYTLYENVGKGEKSPLQVVVGGTEQSIGARVVVKGDHEKLQRTKKSESDYLSQESRVLQFTPVSENVNIMVEWPDGKQRNFSDVRTGARLVVSQEGIVERYELE